MEILVRRSEVRNKAIALAMALLLVVALVPVTPAQAIVTTWYVNVQSGSDANTGTSAEPFKTITAGLAAASAGDTVMVAPGTYVAAEEDLAPAILAEGETFPLMIPSGVTLRSSGGSAVTIIDGELMASDSLIVIEEVSDVWVQGFTVVHGTSEAGGGALVLGSDDVTFIDVVFEDNFAMIGGGMLVVESSITLYECAFIGEPFEFSDDIGTLENGYEANAYAGGGIVGFGSDLAIYDSEFFGNSAYYLAAGGLFEACTVEMSGVTADQNIVIARGPVNEIRSLESLPPDGVSADGLWTDREGVDIQENGLEDAVGGGFAFFGSIAEIADMTFSANGAPNGGAIYADQTSDLTVTDSVFDENFAMIGAGVSFGATSSMVMGDLSGLDDGTIDIQQNGFEIDPGVLIEKSVFTGNWLAENVVDIWNSSEIPSTIVNCLFSQNYTWMNTVRVEDTEIWNSTFADNEVGGGMVVREQADSALIPMPVGYATASIDASSSVVNGVFWGNHEEDSYELRSTEVNGGGIDILGGYVAYTNAEHAVLADVYGDGNISEDPLFISSMFGDYRLRPGSPSIDTGTNDGAPADDLLGTDRPFDGDFSGEAITDMGAYEYVPEGAERLGGSDRYATSAAISEGTFGFAETVLIARGDAFPDGLTASGLAGLYEAPVLLTRSDSLSAAVADEIVRLGAMHAVVVGGPVAVSGNVVEQLEGLGLFVERIGGLNRYETAEMIAEEIADWVGPPEVTFLVRGDTFPDALAVSPVAYSENAPILLARPGEMPDPGIGISDYLMGTSVYIAGGTEAVSEEYEDSLSTAGLPVTRISGANRYVTSALFAEHAVDEGWARFDFVGIATGRDFPDALAGGAAIGSRDGVLMLTAQNSLNSEVERVLSENKAGIFKVEVFGGPAALSAAVLNAIKAAIAMNG